jgi:2-iminobutanoate/2-iminopropanoate deaminase
MSRLSINPTGSPTPASYYSHGLRVGPVLYTAGQTARKRDGELVGVGNAKTQATQAFSNLMRVLEEVEMKPIDVVRLTIFVRARADLPAIMCIRDQYFDQHRPAFSTCVVESLAYPEYLLEVEAIAIRDSASE